MQEKSGKSASKYHTGTPEVGFAVFVTPNVNFGSQLGTRVTYSFCYINIFIILYLYK